MMQQEASKKDAYASIWPRHLASANHPAKNIRIGAIIIPELKFVREKNGARE